MIICLLGASGSGKSTLEEELSKKFGYKKIVSHTTRKPRIGEINGVDYHFIDNARFEDMIRQGLFAEYDEYSKKRVYGTLKSDYQEGNKVVVLTPNGLRQLKKNCQNEDIFTVLVIANLGTRIKRYIDRCGVDKFDFDDKNEIAARVERDYAMFLGIEREVDFIVANNDDDYIFDVAKIIHDNCQDKISKEQLAYTE